MGSDGPERKPRRRSLTPWSIRPISDRTQKVIGLVATLLTAAGGAAASTWVWLDGQASDAELHDAIRDHDQGTYRDPRTGDLVPVHLGQFDQLDRLRVDLDTERRRHDALDAQVRRLYRIMAGRLAAEAEPNRRRRAQAATLARERFDAHVRAGRDYDDALGAALSPLGGLPR